MAKERYEEIISNFNVAFGLDYGSKFSKSNYQKLLNKINDMAKVDRDPWAIFICGYLADVFGDDKIEQKLNKENLDKYKDSFALLRSILLDEVYIDRNTEANDTKVLENIVSNQPLSLNAHQKAYEKYVLANHFYNGETNDPAIRMKANKYYDEAVIAFKSLHTNNAEINHNYGDILSDICWKKLELWQVENTQNVNIKSLNEIETLLNDAKKLGSSEAKILLLNIEVLKIQRGVINKDISHEKQQELALKNIEEALKINPEHKFMLLQQAKTLTGIVSAPNSQKSLEICEKLIASGYRYSNEAKNIYRTAFSQYTRYKAVDFENELEEKFCEHIRRNQNKLSSMYYGSSNEAILNTYEREADDLELICRAFKDNIDTLRDNYRYQDINKLYNAVLNTHFDKILEVLKNPDCKYSDFKNQISKIAQQTLKAEEAKNKTASKNLILPTENNPRLLNKNDKEKLVELRGREVLANPIEIRLAKATKQVADVEQSELSQAKANLKHQGDKQQYKDKPKIIKEEYIKNKFNKQFNLEDQAIKNNIDRRVAKIKDNKIDKPAVLVGQYDDLIHLEKNLIKLAAAITKNYPQTIESDLFKNKLISLIKEDRYARDALVKNFGSLDKVTEIIENGYKNIDGLSMIKIIGGIIDPMKVNQLIIDTHEELILQPKAVKLLDDLVKLSNISKEILTKPNELHKRIEKIVIDAGFKIEKRPGLTKQVKEVCNFIKQSKSNLGIFEKLKNWCCELVGKKSAAAEAIEKIAADYLLKAIAEPKTAKNNYNKFVEKLAEEQKSEQKGERNLG